MTKNKFSKQDIFYSLSYYTDNPKYITMTYNSSGHVLKIDVDYWEANLKDKTIFAIEYPWSLSELEDRLNDYAYQHKGKADLRKQLQDKSSSWNKKEVEIEKRFDEYTGEPYIYVYIPSSHDIYYFADKVEDVLKGNLRKHIKDILRIRKEYKLKLAKKEEDAKLAKQKAEFEWFSKLLDRYNIDIETSNKEVKDILGYEHGLLHDTFSEMSLSHLLVMNNKYHLYANNPDYFTYTFNSVTRTLPKIILEDAKLLLQIVLFKLNNQPKLNN